MWVKWIVTGSNITRMNVRSKLTLTEKLLYYFLAFIAVIFRLKMEVIPDEQDEEQWIDEIEAKVTKC